MVKRKNSGLLSLYCGDVSNVSFKHLLFLDFEYITTSYRVDGHREHIQEITEAAGISISSSRTDLFELNIKPRIKCTQSAQKKDFEFLEKYSCHNEFDELLSVINTYYIPGETKLISWGGADFHNFNRLCKKYGYCFYLRKDDYIDLSQKYKRYYSLNQAVTLERALISLNITDKYDKHNALPDAEMLLRLFDAMVADGYVDTEIIE